MMMGAAAADLEKRSGERPLTELPSPEKSYFPSTALSIFFFILLFAPFVVQHPDARKKRYDDPAKKEELICANALSYVMSGSDWYLALRLWRFLFCRVSGKMKGRQRGIFGISSHLI